MQKLFIITILVPFLLNSQDCAKNPFLKQFYEFLTTLPFDSLSLQESINNYLPSNPQESQNLKTCKQFTSSSCCTADFESALENLVQTYYLTRAEEDYPLTKIMNSLQNSISDCARKDHQKISESSTLKEKIFQYKKLIATLIDANVKFLRGNLCILCAAPSDYNNYLSTKPTLQLILQKASYDSYITQVSSTLKALQSLIPEFKSLLSNYVEQQSEKGNCSTRVATMNASLDKLQFCVGQNCDQQIRARVNAFKQEIDDELLLLDFPDFKARILSELTSFILTSDGKGLNTFITKDTDSQIQYQGVKMTDVFNSWSYRLLIPQFILIIIQY